MGKVKHKLTDEAAHKKAAAEARKQRDLKKFGKQVQVAKLQERDKAKRETLDKINILKRSNINWTINLSLEVLTDYPQNGEMPTQAKLKRTTSSTSLWRMQARRTSQPGQEGTVQAARRTTSVRSGMRSLDLVGRRGSRRAETRRRVLI